MKISTVALNGCILVAVALFAGCGKSNSTSGPEETSQPAMPQTQAAVTKAADEAKQTLAVTGSSVVQTAKAAAADAVSQFATMAKAQSDNVLSSIGQDLAAKAKSLSDSCAGNPEVKTNLDNSLTAMTSGKDGEALAPAFQVAQGANLTPGQLQLAKEVGNLASAFVVQRNFSSLSGSEGDVAVLVTSLRNGQLATALPPLQKIANNASLTPAQKELISSVADKYAPSLKQAAGAVEQKLQGLGVPGLKK